MPPTVKPDLLAVIHCENTPARQSDCTSSGCSHLEIQDGDEEAMHVIEERVFEGRTQKTRKDQDGTWTRGNAQSEVKSQTSVVLRDAG